MPQASLLPMEQQE